MKWNEAVRLSPDGEARRKTDAGCWMERTIDGAWVQERPNYTHRRECEAGEADGHTDWEPVGEWNPVPTSIVEHDHGWLAPNGLFYTCGYGGHLALADGLAHKFKVDATRSYSGGYAHADDDLLAAGWLKIQAPMVFSARTRNLGDSRNWVKQFWSTIRYEIPEDWRICGENVYATHSIKYTDLSSYFLGFSVWNHRNECLSWGETLDWFELLGIQRVRTLYDGEFDEADLQQLHVTKRLNFQQNEGYVLRVQDSFPYSKFNQVVGKFVRPDHVKTTKHWMHGQPLIRNELSE